MRNEIGFAALGGQEGESEETLEYFDQVGCKFIALDQDLEKIVLDYVRFSKRPLLVFILGTSVLNQNHLSQVTEVLKDQNFDSLDLLLQIVAGDGKVGYDIVNMIRSKVTGTITSIVPCVLSGPGSLIALGTDQVIGTVTSSIAPPNFVTLHPAIRVWHIGKGKVHPAYYENQAEYNQLHPQNYEYAKKILSDKESEQLLNHMQFRSDVQPQNYLVSRLFDFGLKGHIASGDERIRLNALRSIVTGAMGDFIYLVRCKEEL